MAVASQFWIISSCSSNLSCLDNNHASVSGATMPAVKLPSIVTPALLSSIRGQPQLPHHSWYFIAGVTLSVLNRPNEIADVFKCAMETGPGNVSIKPEHDEQLRIARKMREALVKAAPIGGLPKVGGLHETAHQGGDSSFESCLI